MLTNAQDIKKEVILSEIEERIRKTCLNRDGCFYKYKSNIPLKLRLSVNSELIEHGYRIEPIGSSAICIFWDC